MEPLRPEDRLMRAAGSSRRCIGEDVRTKERESDAAAIEARAAVGGGGRAGAVATEADPSAILSLLVCGSRVGPAPRAESEGRRRRRKVRGAASVLAEPPPQVEDGRTPATGGACSPEGI